MQKHGDKKKFITVQFDIWEFFANISDNLLDKVIDLAK